MMRRRVITLVAASLGGIAAVAVGLGCFGFYGKGIDNAYALWGAGDMVVAYMADHDDAWPRGWEDLRPYFAEHSRVGGWSFEQFRERVEIDWSADPKLLAESKPGRDGRPTFHVIRARRGPEVTWSQGEPNTTIYEYLRHRRRSATVSSTRPSH